MTRKTVIDELEAPATDDVHLIGAPSEARLDTATERYVVTLGGEPPPGDGADEAQQASSDPLDLPTNQPCRTSGRDWLVSGSVVLSVAGSQP